MNEKIISVDIGFGDTKVVTSSGEEYKFPSAIACIGKDTLNNQDDGLFVDRSYEYMDMKWLVGKEALYHKGCFSTRDKEFILRYTPLLAYRAIQFMPETPTHLATGLPLLTFVDRAYREKLRERLQTINVNGETIELDVHIFAQGAGIFYDYAFTDEGLPNGDRDKEPALVLDVGFNTIDVLCVKNEGEKTTFNREGSITLEGSGVVKICEQLSNYIQNEYSLTLSEQALKDILQKGELQIYGAVKPLGGVIEEIVSVYVDWLEREINTRWNEFLRTEAKRIILGGGGAYYIKESLGERYKVFNENFVCIPEGRPEYSNARGFLKFLRLKLRAGE